MSIVKRVCAAVLLVASLLAGVVPGTGDVASAAAVTGVDIAVSGGKMWRLTSDGTVSVAGGAGHHGDVSDMHLNGPPQAIVPTPGGGGYWILGADGGVFTFGDAKFYGSTGAMRLNGPIVGMEATTTGKGYWLLGADGGIFTFGDAGYHGSTGAMRLNAPMVDMAVTSTGKGYWLLGADGGVFSFGDAAFHGSTGAMRLNAPVNQMATTPTGEGYWLAAGDGGVFTFGDARFHGSAVGHGSAVVSIAVSSAGYVQLLENGSVIEWPLGTTAQFGPVSPGAPPTTGPHKFLYQRLDGTYHRWDPCSPIRVAVNWAGSEHHGDAHATVHEAVRRVREATGLDLYISGSTTGTNVPPNAEMVIFWAGPEVVDNYAGLAWVFPYPGGRIGWARIALNTKYHFDGGFGTSGSLGTLVLHELGHAVGLDHVDDTGQLMYPVMRNLPGYGNGDREGLWRLGAAQGCLPSAAMTASAGTPSGPPAVDSDEWILVVD